MWNHGTKNILHHLEVVRALSDKRFPSYERFCEEVIFQKCEFAFSWGFFVFFVFELCGIMGQKTILHHLEVVRALSDKWFPSYERFCEEVIFQNCGFAFS